MSRGVPGTGIYVFVDSPMPWTGLAVYGYGGEIYAELRKAGVLAHVPVHVPAQDLISTTTAGMTSTTTAGMTSTTATSTTAPTSITDTTLTAPTSITAAGHSSVSETDKDDKANPALNIGKETGNETESENETGNETGTETESEFIYFVGDLNCDRAVTACIAVSRDALRKTDFVYGSKHSSRYLRLVEERDTYKRLAEAVAAKRHIEYLEQTVLALADRPLIRNKGSAIYVFLDDVDDGDNNRPFDWHEIDTYDYGDEIYAELRKAGVLAHFATTSNAATDASAGASATTDAGAVASAGATNNNATTSNATTSNATTSNATTSNATTDATTDAADIATTSNATTNDADITLNDAAADAAADAAVVNVTTNSTTYATANSTTKAKTVAEGIASMDVAITTTNGFAANANANARTNSPTYPDYLHYSCVVRTDKQPLPLFVRVLIRCPYMTGPTANAALIKLAQGNSVLNAYEAKWLKQYFDTAQARVVETFALHHMLQSKYGKVTSVHTTHVMPRAFWNSPRPGSEPKGDGVFVFWITDTESVPIGTFPTESQLHSTR